MIILEEELDKLFKKAIDQGDVKSYVIGFTDSEGFTNLNCSGKLSDQIVLLKSIEVELSDALLESRKKFKNTSKSLHM
jgi:hypothetical protein